MSFKFDIPTEDQARSLLALRRRGVGLQDEMYKDAIACQRRLVPVTTPEERAAAREYSLNTRNV